MLRFLEKMRRQSEQKKQRFVIFASSSIVLVIFLVWLASLFMRFGAGDLTLVPEGADTSFFGASAENLEQTWGKFVETMGHAVDKVRNEYAEEDAMNAAAAASSTMSATSTATSTEEVENANI